VRLVSAVLGFVLRKLGLFLGVLLSLFVGLLLVSALVPTLQQAEADRDRLEQVAEERAELEGDLAELERTTVEDSRSDIEAAVSEGRRKVTERAARVADERGHRDEVCGFVESLPERLPFGPNPCEAARKALVAAQEALDDVERDLAEAKTTAAIVNDPDLTTQQKYDRLADAGLSPVQRQTEAKQAALARTKAEERSLQESQGSWAGRVVNLWARSWQWLAWIALVVIVLPPVVRVVSYFVLMPVVARAHRPMRLAPGAETLPAGLGSTAAQRTLTVELGAGEVLSARSEHVRPVQGTIRSRLLYDWSSPFISFAAGLYGLSRVTGTDGGSVATLATPDDPDSYLMRIDFKDHPGVVMRPRHVVGVIGEPELFTRWRWGIQSLATWQVRYILFAGTGSLIVQGSGDVQATSPGGLSSRIEQHLLMGFDARLTAGVNRTEVFWPYLWGKTPLVDDEFTGDHLYFWQKSTAEGTASPIARTFDAFFSALGKLLGF
jgi:hypothetical protein